MPKRSVELRIPSHLGYEKVAIASASSIAKGMGFSKERIEDLKTAVAEACINAIEHGNEANADMKVIIILTMDGSKLEINIKDKGRGFSKKNIITPDIVAKVEGKDKNMRGWGMFLIKSLVDEVQIETDSDEGGNITKMIIHLEN